MTRNVVTNTAASVHQRLLNVSKAQGRDHTLTLRRYAIERLLYRLGQSPHAEDLVLKGAMLYAIWDPVTYRPTRDADLLGFGDSSTRSIVRVFAALCGLTVEPDDLEFDPGSIRIAEIREDDQYGGRRVELIARMGDAVIPVQVDVAFGDAVTPPAEMADLPTILPNPAPRLRVYPKETVIAEKLQAIVVLGAVNCRLKDYYDIWFLSQTTRFDAQALCSAIDATFQRRSTALPPAIPAGLTSEYATENGREAQWQAFLARHGLRPNMRDRDLATLVVDVAAFLMPCLFALTGGAPGIEHWPPGGPWSSG